MPINHPNNYGKYISPALADYLRAYTNDADKINTSAKYQLHYNTLKGIIYRKHKITELTAPAIEDLMSIAITNAKDRKNKDALAEQQIKADRYTQKDHNENTP